MLDFPDDIRALASSFDSRWPLIPAIADRPVRIDMWVPCDAKVGDCWIPNPARAADLERRLAHFAEVGIPCERPMVEGARPRAWFRDIAEAHEFMPKHPNPTGCWWSGQADWEDRDGREHRTLVLEYILANGIRHLHAWDDYGCGIKGVRYNWLDGNWSHDCNRASEVVRDGVVGHGFTLDSEGHPDTGGCPHTITLGCAVLRRRNRATGEVRFEVAIEPGEDGVVSSFD